MSACDTCANLEQPCCTTPPIECGCYGVAHCMLGLFDPFDIRNRPKDCPSWEPEAPAQEDL